MPKILIVEDDKDIVNNLTEYLRDEGFDVDSAGGQNEAINKMDKNKYDLLLVDISLKDGNGFAVCSAARENNDIPVIFLSASDDEYNIVTGLEIGADDYIVKPFRPRELLSRIRKALRRNGKAGAVIEHDNIRVDTVRGIVTKNGSEISFPPLNIACFLSF